jgi:deoxyribodipyrimidine photo-lyase
MTDELGIVWFRRDLRLDDNPAWAEATASCRTVLALFVLDPRLVGPSGPARRDRLFGDLRALQQRLRDQGGDLLVRTGDPVEVVAAAAREFSAGSVHVNLDVSPFAVRRDAAVHHALDASGVRWSGQWGTLVHPPGAVRTAAGGLSQVFTPFHKVWSRTPWTPWPEAGDATVLASNDEPIPTSGPYPFVSDQHGAAVEPGELGAAHRLAAAAERADHYDEERNTPSIQGTSELSADLKFGTISPRTAAQVIGESSPGRAALVRQLAWRDWYAHLLYATPALVDAPMKPQYSQLVWRDDDAGFLAWTQGRTGVPFVDAGMRQLLATGWMHNRVRMVTASFLVKNLLVDWRRGERYFRHVLVDADVSQNVGNWQWVAGTGPDASPYNRIFNPVLQGQRFDPRGSYIRNWVPELAGLDDRSIHEPWLAGPLELAAAGVTVDLDYPSPIIDLRESRLRALAAYEAVRAGR